MADDTTTENEATTENKATAENETTTENEASTGELTQTDDGDREIQQGNPHVDGAGAMQGSGIPSPQISGAVAHGAASSVIKKVAGAAGSSLGGKVAQHALGAAMSGLMNMGRRDPTVQFSFMVEIDGLSLGMFSEIGGIEWEMRSQEIKEGGVNNHEQHLLGRAKFTPLTLKRGFVAADNLLFQMMHQSMDPNTPIQRQIVHIIPMARSTGGGMGGLLGMNELGRITFYDCFVQKWTGPGFNTKTNDIAVETITFKYNYFAFHPGGPLSQLMEAGMTGGLSAIGKGTPGI
ncbi:MAG TPA: phage tail protein [Myxococcales bacterium]|nr:phage tail protein [Myxococcales bacterium]HIN86130.1 phage tail protein [Myxococcales bacterium]